MPIPAILVKEEGRYRFPLFEKSGLRVLFTTRCFDMAYDSRGRETAYRALGLDAGKLVCSSQIHSDHIFVVEKKHAGRGATGRATSIKDNDSLITARAGIPISVLTADCLPVVLWSSDKRAAAVVHAGWRGVELKIIAKTLNKMAQEFGVSPKAVTAVLGPSIRSCCYEVGPEFRGRFPGSVDEKKGKLYFDIAGEACRQLEAAGVRGDRIYECGICTCCAAHAFFSHRREGESAGRSMTVAEILEHKTTRRQACPSRSRRGDKRL